MKDDEPERSAAPGSTSHEGPRPVASEPAPHPPGMAMLRRSISAGCDAHLLVAVAPPTLDRTPSIMRVAKDGSGGGDEDDEGDDDDVGDAGPATTEAGDRAGRGHRGGAKGKAKPEESTESEDKQAGRLKW